MGIAAQPRPLGVRFLRPRPIRWLFRVALNHPQISVILSLWTVAAAVLGSAILSNNGYPGRDSGIFLYIGQSILEGKLPLRDVWDSKPPGVFYVDALGLLIGRGSIVGVWFIELISISAAVLISTKIITRAFGLRAAFFGTMTWLVGLFSLLCTEGTNSIEEYTLPLKFGAFWLFLEGESRGYRGWRGLALGAVSAGAFLLRQNLIGVSLAIAVYMLISRLYQRAPRRLLMEWLWIFLGGIVVIVAVLAYYAANSGLAALIDTSFLYNLYYSAATSQKRLKSVIIGLDSLSKAGIGVIGVASWMVGILSLATEPRSPAAPANRLLMLALIAFPLEVMLTGVSGRGYRHYYEAWLPVIAILVAFFVTWVLAQRDGESGGASSLRTGKLYLALLVAMLLLPILTMTTKVMLNFGNVSLIGRTSAYVASSTQPGDYVLVWGIEPAINFLSQRRAPSRYIFQHPLFTPGYETPAMVKQFLADLEARPPALVVDASSATADLFPPIDDDRRSGSDWKRWGLEDIYGSSRDTDEIFAYLNRNYRQRTQLIEGDRVVYVYERR